MSIIETHFGIKTDQGLIAQIENTTVYYTGEVTQKDFDEALRLLEKDNEQEKGD